MNIYFCDDDFKRQEIMDVFSSLIWVKRYYTCGDFELYAPATSQLSEWLATYKYIARDDEDGLMMIEDVEIKTDAENGDYYIISGQSLEGILSWRIILPLTIIETNDAAAVAYKLVKENIGEDCAEPDRMVSNFVVDEAFTLPANIKTQMRGANLMQAITELGMTYGFGFRVLPDDSGNFVFSLYQGQETEVVFSKEFDNIINTDYYKKTSNFRNAALVLGEGEGDARRFAYVGGMPLFGGLDLREIYVDARDISSNGGEIPDADYLDMLLNRGNEKLSEYKGIKGYDGEVEPNTTYKYKIDYNLGDVVTVDNGYGAVARPRIIEIIESWDDTGYKVIPTFEKWEAEE